ncbi:hypothetical protein L9F63_008081, partial [Diploptera punctata]
ALGDNRHEMLSLQDMGQFKNLDPLGFEPPTYRFTRNPIVFINYTTANRHRHQECLLNVKATR